MAKHSRIALKFVGASDEQTNTHETIKDKTIKTPGALPNIEWASKTLIFLAIMRGPSRVPRPYWAAAMLSAIANSDAASASGPVYWIVVRTSQRSKTSVCAPPSLQTSLPSTGSHIPST